MKKKLSTVLFVVLIVIFIGSTAQLLNLYFGYKSNADSYQELRAFSPDYAAKDPHEDNETEDVEDDPKEENFRELERINQDFSGWITIQNTDINYPMVHGDDNDHYLTHNFINEYNKGGAIFISSENEDPFSDQNTIIYGHAMKDKSMFGSLDEYKDRDFYTENKIIQISTAEEELEYEIFSAYIETENYYPYKIDMPDEEYVDYLNSLQSRSLFDSDRTEFNQEDKMITLSTCTYEIEDGRFIVHAKLIQ